MNRAMDPSPPSRKGRGISAPFSEATHLSSVLPPLLIEAERVAAAVQAGTHGRRRAGAGETFWQFRRYEQGDPVERIDWRQSARTDKIFIREREWEAAQSAYLWADTSGSMQYASENNLPAKALRAQLLMLALASLLLRGGERVTWMDRRRLTTVHGSHGLETIAGRMESLAPSPTPPLTQPSALNPSGFHAARGGEYSVPPEARINRHSHIILCSDFLMEPEALDGLMRRYAALNAKGALIHIIDPAEESFGFDGRVEMLGCEDEGTMLLPNAAKLRAAYRAKMAAHQARVAHLARSAGWFYAKHVTNAPPQTVLMELYQALAVER